MSTPDPRLPPGELERLAECVLEPIRFPAAIQPHGLFLAIDKESFVITHVSDNAPDQIGADPNALLGRGISDLLDEAAVQGLRAILDPTDWRATPSVSVVGGREFDVIANVSGDFIFVELEPRMGGDLTAIMSTRDVMRRLATAETVGELWQQTAEGVRAITQYDRVMVYHFHPDGHGQVVGEARADDMEPYLGLHYPASDIPAQARALYLTKRSRVIGNSSLPSASLLSDANRVNPTELDLSVAELRAVSPHHLEFMRNMGQMSTFSLSLVRNGVLVGMITCAHHTERRLGFHLRDGLELLANQVALQLGAMQDIDLLTQREGVRRVRTRLVAQIGRGENIVDALTTSRPNLLDFIPADGAAVRISGRIGSVGTVPPLTVLEQLGTSLPITEGKVAIASDALAIDAPELASELPGVAGLLLCRVTGNGDYIAWFRGELHQTVEWLGDMSLQNRATILSPRNSFSAWREEVTGTSAPWGWLDEEAFELGRDLESALLAAAESRLAELALRDSLTGLPNRRLLMDRLEQALARNTRGGGLALLFIDVDKFKAINDSFGHAVGDAVLIQIARALTSAARKEDTVARLGGDEFVILAESVTTAEAESIAERVLQAVTESVGDGLWGATVSIGITTANENADASQVLSAADAAMYRAKVAGRGRSSM